MRAPCCSWSNLNGEGCTRHNRIQRCDLCFYLQLCIICRERLNCGERTYTSSNYSQQYCRYSSGSGAAASARTSKIISVTRPSSKVRRTSGSAAGFCTTSYRSASIMGVMAA